MKFDIIKFNEGRQQPTPVQGVEADSPEELLALFAATGEKIKIVNSYGDDSAQAKALKKAAGSDSSFIDFFMDPHKGAFKQAADVQMRQAGKQLQPPPPAQQAQAQQQQPQQQAQAKFFSVNGSDFKVVGSKLFFKAWSDVNAVPSDVLANEKVTVSSFRVVDDAGHPVDMSDKHLQILLWMPAEATGLEPKQNMPDAKA